MPTMTTAVGLLLPRAERADGVASPVPGSATPAIGVGNPRGSLAAPFPVVGEAMSKSMPVSMVGSAV